MRESGNVFACFTPVAWPLKYKEVVHDPSGHTCIVSLVNQHGRPYRLRTQPSKDDKTLRRNDHGLSFSIAGDFATIHLHGGRCQGSLMFSNPSIFTLDAGAALVAGQPPLPLPALNNAALLTGINTKVKAGSLCIFDVSEVEVYTLD